MHLALWLWAWLLPLLSSHVLIRAAPGLNVDGQSLKRRVRRALPDSPSGDYGPREVACPSQRPTIRSAVSLLPAEERWLRTRKVNTIEPLQEFLSRANIPGFDVEEYFGDRNLVPRIAIAISGGGYRSLMNGAGFLAAADSRVNNTLHRGGIGGLLQSTTYLAGLSGGAWLVGSFSANNYSSITELRDHDGGTALWHFENSILKGPSGSWLRAPLYWLKLSKFVDQKRQAGFGVSMTDYWGRALSYQMIKAQSGGPSYTYSSISREVGFDLAHFPLPVIVANTRNPFSENGTMNSTVIEFNPWEMGTYDPVINAFAPLEWVGSDFINGTIEPGGRCYRGFDQYGFIMGTSSSLFNAIVFQNLTEYGLPNFVQNVVKRVFMHLRSDDDDVADWKNPFYLYGDRANYHAGDEVLGVVDGGEDRENIPLNPVIEPRRKVDVIFASDSSSDTKAGWPDGKSLRATYNRTKTLAGHRTQFPVIPDSNTFINLGLNQRPTFFGCNVNEFSSNLPIPPLIAYIPNSPYSTVSNISTWNPTNSQDKRNRMIKNGVNIATMGNGTFGQDWLQCVACAVLQRSMVLRSRQPIPGTCQRCFDKYCWDGTFNSSNPGEYHPTPRMILDPVLDEKSELEDYMVDGIMTVGHHFKRVWEWTKSKFSKNIDDYDEEKEDDPFSGG